MKKKIVEFISFLLIILTFVLIITSSIRITYFTFSLESYSRYLVFIGMIALIIYIISKIKNFKFTKFEIITFLLIILSCLSLVNALNLNVALFGMKGRCEGLFVILTYYLLFLNCLNIKNRKYLNIIIVSIIIVGILNGLYGLIQVNVIKFPWIPLKNRWMYSSGFLGNSMFYGTFMGMCYSLIVGLFLKCKSKFHKIISYFLVIFFTLCLITSGSMGAFVSILVIFILITFDTIKMFNKDKKIGIIQLLLFLVTIILFICIYLLVGKMIPTLKNETNELFKETSSVTSGNVEENFGTGRIFIWKNTVEKLKDNYLFGVGIDNFYYAFNPPLIDTISNSYVDKAHNEYLQKMLCEGVICGSIYIVFLLMIFFKYLLKNNNSVKYSLFLAFSYYSIQAFFNISITRIAPIYFIIMGLLVSDIKNSYKK